MAENGCLKDGHFQNLEVAGNIVKRGNLDSLKVTAEATLGGALGVTGLTTLNGGLGVTGGADLGGGLGVTGGHTGLSINKDQLSGREAVFSSAVTQVHAYNFGPEVGINPGNPIPASGWTFGTTAFPNAGKVIVAQIGGVLNNTPFNTTLAEQVTNFKWYSGQALQDVESRVYIFHESAFTTGVRQQLNVGDSVRIEVSGTQAVTGPVGTEVDGVFLTTITDLSFGSKYLPTNPSLGTNPFVVMRFSDNLVVDGEAITDFTITKFEKSQARQVIDSRLTVVGHADVSGDLVVGGDLKLEGESLPSLNHIKFVTGGYTMGRPMLYVVQDEAAIGAFTTRNNGYSMEANSITCAHWNGLSTVTYYNLPPAVKDTLVVFKFMFRIVGLATDPAGGGGGRIVFSTHQVILPTGYTASNDHFGKFQLPMGRSTALGGHLPDLAFEAAHSVPSARVLPEPACPGGSYPYHDGDMTRPNETYDGNLVSDGTSQQFMTLAPVNSGQTNRGAEYIFYCKEQGFWEMAFVRSFYGNGSITTLQSIGSSLPAQPRAFGDGSENNGNGW
jgi:hypothetical protein